MQKSAIFVYQKMSMNRTSDKGEKEQSVDSTPDGMVISTKNTRKVKRAQHNVLQHPRIIHGKSIQRCAKRFLIINRSAEVITLTMPTMRQTGKNDQKMNQRETLKMLNSM